MNITHAVIAGAAFALAAAALSSASTVSGNPAADGWTGGGNSLALGNYVRGNGLFDFEMHTSAFTLSGSSNLIGAGWAAGDFILGIGGVITASASNPELSQSVRIVSKFGTSPSSWAPSTITPTNGNGQGSFSGGHGGDGTILLGTYSPAQASSGGHINPNTSTNYMPPGIVHEIPLLQRYDSGSVSTLSSGLGRLIYTVDGTNTLATWQIVLNLSLLESSLPAGAILPGVDDRAIQTLQRSTSSTLFTDSMVTVVPAPGALALLAMGGLLSMRRRR